MIGERCYIYFEHPYIFYCMQFLIDLTARFIKIVITAI